MKRSSSSRPKRDVSEDDRFIVPAAAIFVLALALRLIHVWQIRRAPFFDLLIGDARAYDVWAQQIAQGDWIGRGVFYQAPLYAYFLGLVYTLAGHDLMVVRVSQAILGSLACSLLALAGWRLFSRPAGIAAGVMLACYAPAIFFDGLIQKSLLDLVFLCLMLWLISGLLVGRTESRLPWLWLGVTMGALSLTRENALVFTGVLLVWAVLRGWRVNRPHLLSAGAFVLGLTIVLLPVAVRNRVVGGEFHLTTSQFGPNFYIGNNPRATGGYDPLRPGRGAAQYEREDATALAEQALGRSLTAAEVSGYWTDQALAFIRSQPIAWLTLVATKAGLLWNATEIMDTESQQTYAEWSDALRVAGWLGHFGVLVPLALVGIVVTWPARARTGLLIALIVVYAGSVLMFYVFARYRYPLVPFLVLFAAAGLVAIPEFVRRTPRLRLVGATTLVAGVAVFVNRPLVAADLTRAVTASNMGEALWADGRQDEAIAQYQQAIALKPDLAVPYYNLGIALQAQGKSAEAVLQFERALALQPDYPRAHFNLAVALLSAGRARDAITHVREALTAMPESADAHRILGIALAREQQTGDALAEFREAVRLQPNSPEAHNDLGVALAAAGQLDAAIERFQHALTLKAGFAEAQRNLNEARRLSAPGKTR